MVQLHKKILYNYKGSYNHGCYLLYLLPLGNYTMENGPKVGQQSHHGGIVVTTADNRNGKEVLRIPLFTETVNHRQVAMELQRQIDDDDYNEKDNQKNVIHGRIILTSSIVPYAPHLKVLASSWDTFLTLV
eukprot:6258395-Ditylum_brightwellii.AAC.1